MKIENVIAEFITGSINKEEAPLDNLKFNLRKLNLEKNQSE
jgi:hypothetical protein